MENTTNERKIAMENEKDLNRKPALQELSDEELNQVAGGGNKRCVLIREKPHWCGVLQVYAVYEWKGTDDNKKYLCPNCHRPVHPGSWGRYYCDPCNESWYVEYNLEMNPNGGWVYMRESSSVVRDPSIPR